MATPTTESYQDALKVLVTVDEAMLKEAHEGFQHLREEAMKLRDKLRASMEKYPRIANAQTPARGALETQLGQLEAAITSMEGAAGTFDAQLANLRRQP